MLVSSSPEIYFSTCTWCRVEYYCWTRCASSHKAELTGALNASCAAYLKNNHAAQMWPNGIIKYRWAAL